MEIEIGDHAQNDIENPSTPLVTSSLTLELKRLSPLSSKCSIYKVPKWLRVVNEKAYTPQVVSIGPLHHGKEELEAMEEHKKRYLSHYLKRTDVGLEYHMKIIKEKEELRSCYAEPIKFSTDKFVEIVLVDAAFIIEVLLRFCFPQPPDEQDLIFNKPWMWHDILPDMLLLENQLPFFILEDLLNVLSCNSESLSIVKLTKKFFKATNLGGTDDYFEQNSPCRIEHFVDFLRKFNFPWKPKSGVGKMITGNIPSVTKLYQAGVKFKVRSNKNLFDIQFSEGILQIPELRIEDRTELIIRNLVAFEQCHCRENYMSNYVVIVDRLVNTRADVDLLVKHGIFENCLGDSKQVATLINKLSDGVNMHNDRFYFAQISDDLCQYCRTPWHKWKVNLKQNYCHTPWATLSVIAAVLLIILTFIQTVCSIISFIVKDSPPH